MRAQKILALPKWASKKSQPAPQIYQPSPPPPSPPIVNDRSLTNVLHAKKKGVVGAKLKERPVF